jgi:hypothetical protein
MQSQAKRVLAAVSAGIVLSLCSSITLARTIDLTSAQARELVAPPKRLVVPAAVGSLGSGLVACFVSTLCARSSRDSTVP